MSSIRGGINIDLSGLDKLAAKFPKVVEEEALKFADEIASEGARIARVALNDAVTWHGTERMANGYGISAGRNYTGRMRSRLHARKGRVDAPGNIRAEVGFSWAEKYMIYQESGTGAHKTGKNDYDPNWVYPGSQGGGIVGAHSLWTARRSMELAAANGSRDLKRRITARTRSK